MKVVRHFSTMARKASFSLAGTRTVASDSLGMALRMLPPCHVQSHAIPVLTVAKRVRAISLLALALPLNISTPEWPPRSPLMTIW